MGVTGRSLLEVPEWWSRSLGDVRKELDQILGEEFDGAVSFAEQCHRGQFRKADGPYVIHPFRVCLSLKYEAQVSDRKVLIAALLHDVIEDSGVTRDDLEEWPACPPRAELR